MDSEQDTSTMEQEIADLRSTLDEALKAIAEKQEVDLSLIGDMVEHLTKRLQREIISLDPSRRETMLIQLTEVVTKFTMIEEAFRANAPLPAGPSDEALN
ncbi:MAG: hypothetical protein HN644_08055 [Rhodospirillales bacterium]|jgi:hypothetical protein|nr:hypothetical protein [Rhodospirillales bacterium]MBT4039440.1 hypothetical protein [Rhodospirillales bacterium]MBT4626582.1 hypothetical protein [Rhodospirillales bacterium]MBT5352426.1 hypothetical protein [Rhodospirillales bacterium]MBT5520440.1 hypothetical protein [Rhodospirillales bacterium]